MTQTLEELKGICLACTKCGLCKTRTNVVFGRGNEHARIMLIGEAPGKNEDLQGEPFVGAAGRTLSDVLATANIDVADVYIANVLKCRPPENRNPEPQEIAACTPHLDAQIEAIDPDVIICLGAFATNHMLGEHAKNQPMGALRGRIWQIQGRYVLPTYHPAATIYDHAKRPALTHDLLAANKLVERAREYRKSKGARP